MTRAFGSKFLTSAQYDDAKAFVGSSPFAGETASTGIRVPPIPTIAQNRRYLFQLFSASVQPGARAIIHSLHQLVYIGTELEEEHEQLDAQWLLEIPVTDPLWCFPDGNISWHLRTHNPSRPDTTIFQDFPFGFPYSNRRDTTDSCLLARVPAAGPPNTYMPLNGGQPYGVCLAGLGAFRDLRFPWIDHNRESLGIVVEGPAQIVLYASVYQTNPENRPNKPVGIETAGLRPEDLFVLNYPLARYTRVGGRIKFEIQPMEDIRNG
jgi:hypothetical protein